MVRRPRPIGLAARVAGLSGSVADDEQADHEDEDDELKADA